MADYEKCRANLEELSHWYSSRVARRNEATTRLHLIDELFMRCLGWQRDDVVAEERCEGQYADYVFSAPRQALVVEAKKEGDYFELPVGRPRLEYSLKALCRDYPNLKRALDQVAQYCQRRGVPFAAVSNGHQLVAFLGSRNDAVAPLAGKALVWESLESMLADFRELWQALSKPSVQEKRFRRRLVGDILPELPAKPSASMLDYPGVKARNPFQTDMQIVSELVMEDIAGAKELEERFLRECYCQSGALSQDSLLGKRMLQARYASLFDPQAASPMALPASDKKGLSPDFLAQTISRRPVLLIGDVGVGKTMFIRHFIKIGAAAELERAIVLYVDFGSQAAFVSDLGGFLAQDITKQLRKDYGVDIEERNFIRGAYHGELLRFARGIYSDLKKDDQLLFRRKELEFLETKLANRQDHVRSALAHIASGRRQQVVVFLDNCDQRDHETQERVFLVAQEMAASWPVAVFVSLRPETFHRSQKKGTLSGYHPKAFTIAPPRIDQVLERRLAFGIRLCSGEIPLESLPDHVTVNFQKLGMILEALRTSLQDNPTLREFVDNISGGNVRQALGLVRTFLGSGHVDTRKIVSRVAERGSYTVPVHEVLRAVIYGDNIYFHPDHSLIANLFDVTRFDPREHFLLPLLLGVLSSVSSPDSDTGFVETGRVYERLQGLGFIPDQIDAAIIRGHHKKLIETSARETPEPDRDMPVMLRATTVGLYHIGRLCRTFVYLDAVVDDTPVFDTLARTSLEPQQTISRRLDRGETFCNYLDRKWELLNAPGAAFNWPTASAAIREDIATIRIKAEARSLRDRQTRPS